MVTFDNELNHIKFSRLSEAYLGPFQKSVIEILEIFAKK